MWKFPRVSRAVNRQPFQATPSSLQAVAGLRRYQEPADFVASQFFSLRPQEKLRKRLGAEESGSEFPDKLLDRVGVIAEPLAELPIAAALVAGEVRQLVKQGRIVGFGRRARWRASEGLARGQVDFVGRAAIEGA